MEAIRIFIMVLLGIIIVGFLLYNVIDLIKRIVIIVKQRKKSKQEVNIDDGSCDSSGDS